MRTLLTYILLQLIVVGLTAQNSSDIYRKGWIDFNKNGKKDIYEDPSQSTEARISNLMGQMTLGEKVAQLQGGWFLSWQAYTKNGEKVKIAGKWKEAYKLRPIGMLGAVLRADPWTGVTLEKGLDRRQGAEFVNTLHRYFIENTRLGIPAFVTDDGNHCQHGIGTTIFPSVANFGLTWNPALQEEIGRAIATESRTQGVTVTFSPNLDVIRDPRLGRSDQNYGEDPYHVSQMGVAMVKGFQGEKLSSGTSVAALLRAYPGVGDMDGGHDFSSGSRGIRDMHEVVLPPWKEAVKAGAAAVMVEQCVWDGVPIGQSKYYLTELLRDEWGFKGMAMADAAAVSYLRKYRTAKDNMAAGVACLKAGMDINLTDFYINSREVTPVTPEFNSSVTAKTKSDTEKPPFESLVKATELNMVSEAEIDSAVYRVLNLKFLLGLFDSPFTDPQLSVEVARCEEHTKLALEAARQSIVLLKNSKTILPLSKTVRSIALIGPNADNTWNQLGDYAPTHERKDVVTILDGIRNSLPSAQINYAEGCKIRNMSKDGFKAAIAAAKKSDIVIAVVGGSSKLDFPNPGDKWGRRSPEADCGESADRATLDLMGVQNDLLVELKKTGKPLIVVLIHGRAMSINWIKENADAIVDAWYPGQAGGTAVAEVLFGDYNPGGKLTVSYPKHVGQLPVYYYSLTEHRRDYIDMDSKPLFPFGFGLSYTSFKYSKLRLSSEVMHDGETISAMIDITNTGDRDGDEIVQLYLQDKIASTARPFRELKGFERVHLKKGETKTVTFEINTEHLMFFGLDNKWIVEPGEFLVFVGRDSQDKLFTKQFRYE